MSNRPSPLGWLTKFVVVPAAVAALGYYVVGPRVGGKMAAPAQLASLRDQWVAKATPAQNKPEHVTMSAPAASISAGPQVDVDVHPAVNRPVVDVAPEEPPKPRRRKKRRKKAPKPVESTPTQTVAPATAPTVLEPAPATAPPPVDPPTDQGGSGGAATAGGAGI